MISPVSQPESSEARNTATPAMSDGVPMRPSGVMATSCFSNSIPTPYSPAAREPSVGRPCGRRIVNPRLVPQDQLFQRGAFAVLGSFHQFGICRTTIIVLGEGIKHASSPCPCGTDVVGAGASPGHLDTVDG